MNRKSNGWPFGTNLSWVRTCGVCEAQLREADLLLNELYMANEHYEDAVRERWMRVRVDPEPGSVRRDLT